MKKSFILCIISAVLVLSSCSVSRNADFTSNLHSRKMQACEQLVKSNSGEKMAVTVGDPACIAEAQTHVNDLEPGFKNCDAQITKRNKVNEARNSFTKSAKLITRNFSMSNLDKQVSKLATKTNSHTTAWNPGDM